MSRARSARHSSGKSSLLASTHTGSPINARMPVPRPTTVFLFQLRQPVLGVLLGSYSCSCTLVLVADLSTYDLYGYVYCCPGGYCHGQSSARVSTAAGPGRREHFSLFHVTPRLSLDAISGPSGLCLPTVCSVVLRLPSPFTFLRVWRFFCHARPCCPPVPPGGGGGSHLARW